jgi:hypothetical protein
MNWEMITALAAVIGSIAIVASLLYVAQQMRKATRQMGVESYHSVLSEVDDFCKLVAHDHANADILWRASKGIANLTDAERVRYFAMLFIMFRSWEKAFRYQVEGELDEWTSDVVTRPMADFAMSDGVQEYWALRKRWYAADFRDWVDKQIKERSGVDPYGEDFRIFGSADAKGGS